MPRGVLPPEFKVFKFAIPGCLCLRVLLQHTTPPRGQKIWEGVGVDDEINIDDCNNSDENNSSDDDKKDSYN